MFINRILVFLNIRFKRVYYKMIFKNKMITGERFSFKKRMNILIGREAKLTIGNNVFFNNDCSINCLNSITIGDNVLFGENVKIYDHNHEYRNQEQTIRSQGLKLGSIKIGNNIWIGSNVIILNDVEIGDNCVIGAGVTIYKNIPKNSIVKNNQSLIIKDLYTT